MAPLTLEVLDQLLTEHYGKPMRWCFDNPWYRPVNDTLLPQREKGPSRGLKLVTLKLRVRGFRHHA